MCPRRHATPGSRGQIGADSNERGAGAGVCSAPSRGDRTGPWGPHCGGVLVSCSGWEGVRAGQGVGPRQAPPPKTQTGSGCLLASEPCGFEATYLELASAVKEQYPGIEIESRLGGTGEAHRTPAESGF